MADVIIVEEAIHCFYKRSLLRSLKDHFKNDRTIPTKNYRSFTAPELRLSATARGKFMLGLGGLARGWLRVFLSHPPKYPSIYTKAEKKGYFLVLQCDVSHILYNRRSEHI